MDTMNLATLKISATKKKEGGFTFTNKLDLEKAFKDELPLFIIVNCLKRAIADIEEMPGYSPSLKK